MTVHKSLEFGFVNMYVILIGHQRLKENTAAIIKDQFYLVLF